MLINFYWFPIVIWSCSVIYFFLLCSAAINVSVTIPVPKGSLRYREKITSSCEHISHCLQMIDMIQYSSLFWKIYNRYLHLSLFFSLSFCFSVSLCLSFSVSLRSWVVLTRRPSFGPNTNLSCGKSHDFLEELSSQLSLRWALYLYYTHNLFMQITQAQVQALVFPANTGTH